jgi:hypothetical protein
MLVTLNESSFFMLLISYEFSLFVLVFLLAGCLWLKYKLENSYINIY